MIFKEVVSKKAVEICTLVHKIWIETAGGAEGVVLLNHCRNKRIWMNQKKKKFRAFVMLLDRGKIPLGYSHLLKKMNMFKINICHTSEIMIKEYLSVFTY